MHRTASLLSATAIAISLGLAAPAAHAGKAPQVKLLSSGKGAKQKLRFTLKPGSVEKMVMRTDMAMAMKLAGKPMPKTKMPTMVMEMTLSIGDRTGGDEARFGYTFDDARTESRPGVQPAVAQAMDKALGSAKGTTGGGIISDRGITRENTINLPAGLPPQMRQAMQSAEHSIEQLASPLPRQAVGVGARWQTKQVIEENGMHIEQLVTYKLLALNGKQGKLAISVVQKGRPQDIKLPGMPAKAHLDKYAATGTGTMRFDLDRLVPTSSVSLSSAYAMTMKMGGKTQTIATKLEMTMAIAPK